LFGWEGGGGGAVAGNERRALALAVLGLRRIGGHAQPLGMVVGQ